jgi:glutathione synthase/RimK-type ligase-like ATP-grasp enzyme
MERSQWSAFLRAISVFKGVKWCNWPQATYLAESKPYQLLLAKEVGFKVPATVVTNDVSDLPEFASNPIILKSLDTALFFKGGDCYFTYTTATTGTELAALDASSAPMIVQKELQGKSDIRVTVIGDEVFAVEILSNGIGIDGDWRIVPRESLEYISIELPSEVETSCRELVLQLDLTFGAIDLIRASGVFYFVEINPTGEWAWLQSNSRDLAGAFVRAICA